MPAGLYGDTDEVLTSTVALGDRFHGSSNGRLNYLLNPRFILSCSDELWRGIETLSSERDWAVHTHALEQLEETEVVRSLKGGLDEIEYFDQIGVLAADFRIAHGVWLTEDHLTTIQPDRFSVVHCPSTNLKLGSGIADLLLIRGAGISVGVGSDGAACNNELDGFKELRLAAQLQHLKHGPDSFSGLDALRLATCEGAEAIGLGDEIGSLEVGKAADVLVLSQQRPEFFGAEAADPHDLIAFGASRAAVKHLIVDGNLLVEDGRLVGLDLARIQKRASQQIAGLLQRAAL